MVSLKRYDSMQDIEAETNYRSKNPIRQENYKDLVGWYRFPDGQEAECCFQKPNGNLCKTKHLRGWVMQIADGTLTIIGKDCGNDKFEASSTIGRDIHHATRHLDEQDKLARLTGLMAKRDEALSELAATRAQLADLRKTVTAYRDKLGRVAWNVLTNMSRTGNTTICVLGVTPEVRDYDGEVIRDRRSVEIKVASFSGVAMCDETRITRILGNLRQIEAAYKRAGETPSVQLKPREVKALNAALSDQPREVAQARELMDQLGRFEANDFTALSFTVADIGERLRLMLFGLEQQGKPSSKNAAKKQLSDWESALKLQYGVKQIRIQ